jgi:ATP-dependent DNA helicase RecQ
MPSTQTIQAIDVLKNNFGYSGFRFGQEDIIEALIGGQDVLAVMPTGAGKSICYQIPAFISRALTIVISPLIALMKDQARALELAGIPSAVLNSSLSWEDNRDTLTAISTGEIKLLYIAPERLNTNDILYITDNVNIGMIIIDEAHCISQWGHDFRTSYLSITTFIESLPKRPIVAAFTATATENVKLDIQKILKLKNPLLISTGFDRPNLYFEVRRPANKNDELLGILKNKFSKKQILAVSGIVYCSTRKTVDAVCELLLDKGYSATRYHAGLDSDERRKNQDDFLYDQRQIMVATNAFGMGIDKSNITFVIHYNMPKNIESYYQEAGRAGRDGETAYCIMLYNSKDVRMAEFLIKHSNEDAGVGVGAGIEEIENREQLIANQLQLLKYITFYSTGTDCLRAQLLKYFNEQPKNYCGNCGNCLSHFEKVDVTIDAQKIVSCVYRLKQRDLRFGKTLITQLLKGNSTEQIKKFNLESLTTFGIMKTVNIKRIRDIIDYLIINNYLQESDVAMRSNMSFRVIELTDKSKEIVVDKKKIEIMLSEGKPEESSASKNGLLKEIDETLFTELKILRKDLSSKAKIPPYMVFTDASLHSMCTLLPKNKREFLSVQGVGQVKADKYWEVFTGAIKKYTGE